ncbi:MAG TPA: aminotransferase class III-fold pyridoxal phosphate-dependent enzyme [Acidimicrobiales bacterium]|nr:aminotransferase class III-fold pyridoxal phosphate-dependent enzyme [Acidimicrobiales bacterium]
MSSHLLTNTVGEVLPTVSRGKGVHLWDDTGRRYLDGCSGAVTANLGHGDEEIAAALADQARTIAFVFRSQFTNEPAEELADLVTALAPPGLDRLFLVSSGSEAVEAAAKLARQYWVEVGQPERRRIVSRGTSYHGSTLGALELSDHPPRRRTWESLLDAPLLLPEAHCSRCPLGLTHPSCDLACASALDALVDAHPSEVAAVLVEPVVGAAGGAITPPPGYLARLAERCTDLRVLLVADEVMTGAWRTGGFLACADEGVTPDLVVLGKGLAAGYAPLAGVLVSNRIADAIAAGSGVFLHGHTHGFNPMAARAGLEVIRKALRERVPANVAARGEQLRRGLEALAARHDTVLEVRGRGLLWGLELVADDEDHPRLQAPVGTAAVVAAAKHRGLLVYPAGVGTTTLVLVAPPLVITEQETDELLGLLDATLADLSA